MDKDIEDIRKLDAVIKIEHDHNNFNDEFDDFINHTISDDEEQLEGLDEEELTEIEEAVDNIVDFTDQNRYHNVDNLNFGNDINLVKNFLDLEELKVINSCKDVKLKKLLVLNRAKHVQLQSIRYRLYELLKNCKMSLKSTEDEMEKLKSEKKQIRRGIIPRLGHPYFKTKDFYSSSPNNDTIRKQKSKEITIDYLPQICRWTAEDQVVLKRAIAFNYTLEMIDKYETELKMLENDKKNAVDEDTAIIIENKISEVKEKLKEWKENEKLDPPPLTSDIEINWINISKIDLSDRHSPQACQAFWNIFLHPSINKGDWSEKENNIILEIAKKHNYENWEQISADVNTNRSGFAVCVHYYTTLSDKFKKDRFDTEEDEFLVDVVNACRIGNYIPWSKVAHYFQNRSRSQLYHRYRYNLEYSNMKKGTFSQAEDVLVALLVAKFGKDFTRCCKYIPNRSPTQIGHRYKNYLIYEKMNLGCWSLNEDQIILDHVKDHGAKNWSKLFSLLKMKNRTHLRQRYIFIKQWLTKHPDKELTDIPRRTKSRRGMNENNLEMVKTCVEHFISSPEIPTLYEINEQLKNMGQKASLISPIEIRVKNDNIDKELIQFFQSTCKIRTSKAVSPQELSYIVDVVKILLTTLNVELTVPADATVHTHPQLDVLDMEILKLLFQDAYTKQNTTFVVDVTNEEPVASSSSKNYSVVIRTPRFQTPQQEKIRFNKNNKLSYVPPNINTLVSMRGMLLMYQAYKRKRSSSNQIRKIIGLESGSSKPNEVDISEDIVNLIFSDQEKYLKRFNTIFKWPALMSVMEPNENLVFNNCASKQQPKSKETAKVGRPKKNMIKIELMNKARMNKYLNRKGAVKLTTNTSQKTPQGENSSVKNTLDARENVASSSSSDVNDVEFVDVKQEAASNIVKRNTDCEVIYRQVKRVKIECNSEILALQEDINKLDSVLLSELNDKC